jgi:hypothetical protein
MKHPPLFLALVAIACGSPQSPAATHIAPSAEVTHGAPLLAPASVTASDPAAPSASSSGAPAPSVGTSAAPTTTKPSLIASFEARGRNGDPRPLVSGDTLHHRDHFWLELSTRERLYLYVLYAGADGTATVLYPASGDAILEPYRTQRLPETQDFELDETSGWERILVVASRAPLQQSAAQLGRVVAEVRSTHQFPDELAPPPEPAPTTTGKSTRPRAEQPAPARAASAAPGSARPYTGPTPTLEPVLASADTRGLTRGVRLASTQPGRVEAAPDADGVIAIPLFIRHVP